MFLCFGRKKLDTFLNNYGFYSVTANICFIFILLVLLHISPDSYLHCQQSNHQQTDEERCSELPVSRDEDIPQCVYLCPIEGSIMLIPV